MGRVVTILAVLYWAVLGPCLLACVGIVAALAASAVSDLRYRPRVHWEPGGPWHPRTDPAMTAPLGTLPAAVEEELAKLAALIPDRPAVSSGEKSDTASQTGRRRTER
jgi:hypothetical protein